MNQQLKIFNSPEFGQIRVQQDENGNPWFVAKDVSNALGLDRPSQSTRYLDDDEKGMCLVNTPSGKQNMVTITEAGLYSLVLKSRSENAKTFKRWITHEVLPAIRKTGGYMIAGNDESPEETMARALLIAQEAISKRDERISRLQERNDRQAEIIKDQQPKALFADAVAASDSTCLIGELAKLLKQNGINIGQNRLFGWMRDNDYLGKSGNNYNVPTQRSMDMGLFRIKESTHVHSDGHVTINRTPKVTGKGQRYFVGKFLQQGVI